MESLPVRTLTLIFDFPLRGYQVSRWRGAFIEMVGWEDDRLHNHRKEDGFIYRYPCLQYRAVKGKAGVFALNEGVEALQQSLARKDWRLNWDDQMQLLLIEDLSMHIHDIRVLSQPKLYRIHQWLALNDENYQKWQAAPGLIQRVGLMERILRGHIMACLWGLGWKSDEKISIQITDMLNTRPVAFKQVKLLAFDLTFSVNLSLPPNIGVGKGVSLGFGRLRPLKSNMKMIKNGSVDSFDEGVED